MGGLFGGGGTISTSAPRIGALRVQTSAYGMAIPIAYGRARMPANMIWYGDFTPIAHVTKQKSGGKGGGGGSMKSTTYTYQTALAMGLCEGEIGGVFDVWRTKSLYTEREVNGVPQSALAQLGLSLFTGPLPQTPWGYLTSKHPGEAIGYSGLAYVASGSYDLGDSASLDNHTFEVDALLPYSGTVRDANPAAILPDLLGNARYGAGFPSGKVGDLTAFSTWCVANGLFVSPVYSEQRQAAEVVRELVEAVGCEVVYSESLLKVIPYGDEAVTGNGVTYTPDLTPLYDLGDDDFLGDDEDPVKVRRTPSADAFNAITVEFANRANQYNLEPAEAKDQADIEAYGLRPEEPQKLHLFCTHDRAQLAAQLRLQRKLYVRNRYEFRLGWRYALLEPMDIVTLTDAGLGLDRAPVRIVEIEESEEGELLVIAEEMPQGVASAARYGGQAAAGYSTALNALPGDTLAPLVFEPPLALTGGTNELWVAAAGGAADWGGCGVWVSLDDATYERIGVIYGPARYGTLNADLAAPAADPDLTNSVVVDLNTDGQMFSGTAADRDAAVTLCYVGGELLAYETATLTAYRRYALSSLRRGLYGSPAGAHLAGEGFARLDQAIYRHALPDNFIGQTLYIKLTAFNTAGLMEQDLGEAQAYAHVVQGGLPLGPSGLALQAPFVGTHFAVQWSPSVGATGYLVELWADGVKRRELTVTGTSIAYSLEDASSDGGPWRDWTVKVATLANGQTSGFSQINVSNPVPAAPTGIATSDTADSITVSWSAVADVDLQDYQVWISETDGFTPGAGTLAYTGTATSTTIGGLASATTYYLRVAARDKWGAGALNYSAQVAVTTD